ncbi:MAG: glycoside hydrolase, partial [candidate division KSB1 bacterium]|nr:glycoside hydrolase [candidate division KSB1 bacterium]
WSSSYTPTDYYHDTYQQAAYILDKVKGAERAVTSMSYWVFTDIFEESSPPKRPFHGGFGLLNLQGRKKPAFFAFEFLNRLGDIELVNSDDRSWACKDSQGNVQVLFWDFRIMPNPDSTNNQAFYKRVHPAADLPPCRLLFTNLQAGRYALEIRRVGYRINDVFTAYLEMGAPDQLSRAQEKALHACCSGAPEQCRIVSIAEDGKYALDLTMRENDVVLLTLTRL